MNIEFIPVNDENILDASELHISKLQKGMVETVEECFDEAKKLALWKPMMISMNYELIGFAMYGLWENEGENGQERRVWLDRFFIDERFQGKGYSKIVLPFLLEHIRHEYSFEKIYLSVYESNSIAIHLYETLGFTFNGENDINGEKIMVLTFDLGKKQIY